MDQSHHQSTFCLYSKIIMTQKNHPKLPKTKEKKIFQEANSSCAFCQESEIASLQIHHIDQVPNNNAMDNLLLVCANCHTKITGGVFSEADVRLKKRTLEYTRQPIKDKSPGNVCVNVTGSTFRGDIAHTMTKIVTPHEVRISHPLGSIGAELNMKGYVDYLIAKYFKFRKADSSYGRKETFSHAEIHSSIQNELGHRTFFAPNELFPRLVNYLHMRIDRTILGKQNIHKGIPNYHTYEEHLLQYGK